MRLQEMQAKTGKKSLTAWNIAIMGLFLTSCTSLRLAPVHEAFPQEASFFAMGARWALSMRGLKDPESFVEIKDKLWGFALHYEITFSDWADESELRRIELEGWGTRSHEVSELFMEGLLLSQEAFLLTDSNFDLTTGAMTWKVLPKAVGQSAMHVDSKKLSVSFARDPKRLSFGGIVKGMALGEMAFYLREKGIQTFWIDAGGGNRVAANAEGVIFESRSRIFKPESLKDLNVHSPTGKVFAREKVALMCKSPSFKRSDLIRWGALSDAFSTARLLDNNWVLPVECNEIEN